MEQHVHRDTLRVSASVMGTSALEAIDRYHELLSSDDGLAAETQAALDEAQRRRVLIFGERPLCTVLRPRFTTIAAQRKLEGQMRALLRAFAKALGAALGSSSVRAMTSAGMLR